MRYYRRSKLIPFGYFDAKPPRFPSSLKLALYSRLPAITPLFIDKTKRTLVMVDASNFRHSAEVFNAAFDWRALAARCNGDNCSLVSFITQRKNATFDKYLGSLGYEVFVKPLKRIGSRLKGNVDVQMAIYAMKVLKRRKRNRPEVVIIGSGDSDFSELVSIFKEAQISVWALGFPTSTAQELIQAVDRYIPVGWDLLFKPTRKEPVTLALLAA